MDLQVRARPRPSRTPFREPAVPLTGNPIVAIANQKGGVGKTTLSFELAAAWNAVAVDLDWDRGSLTYMWGAAPNGQLLNALEGGEAIPRPRSAPGRPRLVPGHPDLSEGGWQPEAIADALERWSTSWQAPIVTDTHPGVGELSFAAMSAASIVLIPALLKERELDALEGMISEFRGTYPLCIVPNLIPISPPGRQLRRLKLITEGLHVAPFVSHYPWLARRARRTALVLSPPSKRTAAAVAELEAVARYVRALLEAPNGR